MKSYRGKESRTDLRVEAVLVALYLTSKVHISVIDDSIHGIQVLAADAASMF